MQRQRSRGEKNVKYALSLVDATTVSCVEYSCAMTTLNVANVSMSMKWLIYMIKIKLYVWGSVYRIVSYCKIFPFLLSTIWIFAGHTTPIHYSAPNKRTWANQCTCDHMTADMQVQAHTHPHKQYLVNTHTHSLTLPVPGLLTLAVFVLEISFKELCNRP